MVRICVLFFLISYTSFSNESIYNLVLNDYISHNSIQDTIAISEFYVSSIIPQDFQESVMLNIRKSTNNIFHYKELKQIFEDNIIKDSFKIIIPYIIHSKDLIYEYFINEKTTLPWIKYVKDFPNYHYLFYISKICYNKKQNKCILLIGHFENVHCSYSYYYLKKSHNRWKIIKKQYIINC